MNKSIQLNYDIAYLEAHKEELEKRAERYLKWEKESMTEGSHYSLRNAVASRKNYMETQNRITLTINTIARLRKELKECQANS